MEWFIQLAGHKFDLEELPKWLAGGDFSVLEDGGQFYLTSPILNDLDAPEEVRRAAEEVVEIINGLGRVQWQEFQPISVGYIESRGSDADRKVYISGTESIRVRDKAIAVVKDASGETLPAADSGKLNPWIDLAATDEKVRQAIGYLNRPEVTWGDLYRALEVVESDADISGKGWASGKQLKRFTGTANSYAVLGYAARHAKDWEPPKKPMEFAEARQLVIGVVRNWIEEKAEQ